MLGREGWTPPTLVLQASWVHGARVARSCFPHSCNWVPLSSLCALVEGWNDRRCSGRVAFVHWTPPDLWCIILGWWWYCFCSVMFGDRGGMVETWLYITSLMWALSSHSPTSGTSASLHGFAVYRMIAHVISVRVNRSWLASSNHHSNHIRTSHHTPLVFFSCTTLRTNRADTKRVAHWYHW